MDLAEKLRKKWEQITIEKTRENDFDSFWEKTIELTRTNPAEVRLAPYDTPLKGIRASKLTYKGFDETDVHGWYLIPEFLGKSSYPCLIIYHGFGGDAGVPADFVQWLLMGVAVISVDCRSQSGQTGDAASYSNGSFNNVILQGILDPKEYYWRNLYMDCFKAVDVACSMPEIDPTQIILNGGSQGGALSLAVAALHDKPALAFADVPGNNNLVIRGEGDRGLIAEFVMPYLKKYPDQYDMIMKTLSYFDFANMAELIQCPVLASVGGQDTACPPDYFYPAFNLIQSPKKCVIYPFNGHDGGHRIHNECKLKALKNFLEGRPVF